MRALVCHAYGPIESLKLEDVPKPEPAPGEILVKVGAAGVSFAALLGIQGKHQNKPPLPFVPGNEIAGEIVALGDGVHDLKVGQRIATGGSRGGFAEYCVTIAANAVPIPDAMPYAEATNFPTLYPTAYGALKWKADMKPGEVLLVHGAGGGSGLTGIEVGKAMGATVIASAGGADKLVAAKAAGADHLIDHFARLHEQDRGDRADPVAPRQAVVFVHVHLGQRHAAGGLLREVLENGGNRLTRPAPLGPEVHHEDALMAVHGLVEVLFRQVDGCRVGHGLALLQ